MKNLSNNKWDIVFKIISGILFLLGGLLTLAGITGLTEELGMSTGLYTFWLISLYGLGGYFYNLHYLIKICYPKDED